MYTNGAWEVQTGLIAADVSRLHASRFTELSIPNQETTSGICRDDLEATMTLIVRTEGVSQARTG